MINNEERENYFITYCTFLVCFNTQAALQGVYSPQREIDRQLINVATMGSVAEAEQLFAQSILPDIHAKESLGRTALHFTAANGHQEMVAFLLAKGASINERCSWGETALMAAVTRGDKELIKFLLKAGADVNIGRYGSEWGFHLNPLIIAITAKNTTVKELRIIRRLVRLGAHITPVFDENPDYYKKQSVKEFMAQVWQYFNISPSVILIMQKARKSYAYRLKQPSTPKEA